jgi:serine protease Do
MRAIELFDDYLDGRLSPDQVSDFNSRLLTDETFANAFKEHKKITTILNARAEKSEFKKRLKNIHEKEFGVHSWIISMHKEETFARKHGRTIAVAASTTLIAVLSTIAILSTGGYLLKKQSNEITELKRDVLELKYSSEAIVEGITKNNKRVSYAPANLEGSAFALNNKGYIITSFHMVNGADSIFIQNSSTDRVLAKLIHSDPKLDLAILKIGDVGAIKTWQVPFSLKEKATDIGEKVFTLGYPRKEMVYGEGSLSSLSGYSNDTSMYQISIPVNPGNSGGPLLDDNGNIIGVIRGKISGAEATGFAIKANEILKSIQSIAVDSTRRELLTQAAKKPALKSLKRSEQIRKINPYVFNVLVYKKD